MGFVPGARLDTGIVSGSWSCPVGVLPLGGPSGPLNVNLQTSFHETRNDNDNPLITAMLLFCPCVCDCSVSCFPPPSGLDYLDL